MRATRRPADWTLARTLWDEGVPGKDIAARIGRSADTVYGHAKDHDWPRRYKKDEPRKTTRSRAQLREAKPVTFRCPECGAHYTARVDEPHGHCVAGREGRA